MRTSRRLFIGLLSVVVLSGTAGLLPQSVTAAGFSKRFVTNKDLKDFILKLKVQIDMLKDQVAALGSPFGPGTEGPRFVNTPDGLEVCDNTSGLYWQQSLSMAFFDWGLDQNPSGKAFDLCAYLDRGNGQMCPCPPSGS